MATHTDSRSITRAILVRDAAGRVRHRIDTTHCWWCSDDGPCSACHARANKARAGILNFDRRHAKPAVTA